MRRSVKKIVLSTVVTLCLWLVGCGSKKEVFEESFIEQASQVSNDVKQDSTSLKKVEKVKEEKETVYKGFDESFIAKPNDQGNFNPFRKEFDNGNVFGDYGYDTDLGFYINVNARDTKETERNHSNDSLNVSSTSSIEKKESTSTITDSLYKQIERTRGWGKLQWGLFLWFLGTLIGVFFWAKKKLTGLGIISKLFRK